MHGDTMLFNPRAPSKKTQNRAPQIIIEMTSSPLSLFYSPSSPLLYLPSKLTLSEWKTVCQKSALHHRVNLYINKMHLIFLGAKEMSTFFLCDTKIKFLRLFSILRILKNYSRFSAEMAAKKAQWKVLEILPGKLFQTSFRKPDFEPWPQEGFLENASRRILNIFLRFGHGKFFQN